MKKISIVFFLSLIGQLPKLKFKVFCSVVPSLFIAYSGLQRHRYLQICNLGLKVIRPQIRFFLLNAERSDKNCQNDTVLFMLRSVSFPHQLTDLEQKQLTFKMIARTGAHTVGGLSPLCQNDTLEKRISINKLTDLEQKQLTFKMIARTGAHTVGGLFLNFIQIFKNLVGGLEVENLHSLFGFRILGGVSVGEIKICSTNFHLVGFGHNALTPPAFQKMGH